MTVFGRREVSVIENREVGGYTLLQVQDEKGPAPAAGQFYMLATVEGWCSSPDGRPFLPRAMSSWCPEEGVLAFLLESRGPGSTRMARLKKDDQLYILGPLGKGFYIDEIVSGSKEAVLIAGGAGVVPIIALERKLIAEGCKHHLLAGFRNDLYAEAAKLFSSRPSLAIDSPSQTADIEGPVTNLLIRLLEGSHSEVAVFACGPSVMLEAVLSICRDRGISAQFALETTMACGFGACHGCAVETVDGYIRLCVDGPVVDAELLEKVP